MLFRSKHCYKWSLVLTNDGDLGKAAKKEGVRVTGGHDLQTLKANINNEVMAIRSEQQQCQT